MHLSESEPKPEKYKGLKWTLSGSFFFNKVKKKKKKKNLKLWRSLVPQWVKDLVRSLFWLEAPKMCGFDPQPGNFHMPRVQPNKRKKKLRWIWEALWTTNKLSQLTECGLKRKDRLRRTEGREFSSWPDVNNAPEIMQRLRGLLVGL